MFNNNYILRILPKPPQLPQPQAAASKPLQDTNKKIYIKKWKKERKIAEKKS